MAEKQIGDRRARRRIATALVCGSLVAGSALLATPADAATVPPSASTAPSTTGRLTALDLDRSSSAVYPVRDGFEDSVKFAINPLGADGHLVPVQGWAALSKNGTVVKKWTLDGSKTILSWDGRVQNAVRTGLYDLSVTAWSADSTELTTATKVRVLSRQLEHHTIMVRSKVGASSVSASMPKQLIGAFSKGEVTVRMRTVAKVEGRAKLVFSNGDVTRSIPLRNGTHTTKPLEVPQGFERVTIRHAWKRGTVHLKSAEALWSYSTLE